MPTYYKIIGPGSMFWDAGQSLPENQKLLKGEVKALDPTESVMAAKRAGGLEVVSEADYKTLLEAKEAVDEAANEADAARKLADSAAAPTVIVQASGKETEDALKRALEAEAKAEKLAEEYRKKIADIEAGAAEQRKKDESKEATAKTAAKVKPAEEGGAANQ